MTQLFFKNYEPNKHNPMIKKSNKLSNQHNFFIFEKHLIDMN